MPTKLIAVLAALLLVAACESKTDTASNPGGTGQGTVTPATPGSQGDFTQNVGDHTFFVHSFTSKGKLHSQLCKCKFTKMPYGMSLSCSNYKIFRSFLLKNEPHRLDIILRMPPIPLRIQVP